MSPDEEKSPGKIRQFFGRIAAIPRKLFGISLAARASCLTTIILVVLVVTVWTVFLLDPANVPWRHSMSGYRILAVLTLVVVIPFVTYRGLKLWLEGETSQFPDIDFAWKAGLEALRRNGISLKSTPIFLVLGSENDRQEQALMSATRLDLRVRVAPTGAAPLHWYADADGIYLFATEAGWLSALARLRAKRPLEAATSAYGSLEGPTPIVSGGAAPPAQPGGDAPASVAAPAVESSTPPPAAPAQPPPTPTGSPKGTIMLDQYQDALAQSGAAPPQGSAPAPPAGTPATPPPGAGAPAGTRGTMMLDAPVATAAGAAAPEAPQPATAPSTPTAPPRSSGTTVADPGSSVLGAQESAEQLQRLEYVCSLLRRARQPLCPVNGILLLQQFDMIQSSSAEASELQRAVNADLSAAQHTLQLRCPVTTLIVGLEHERGFQELVRRVGPDRVAAQRFGRGHDARTLSTPDELRALCVHVCGAFEDWVYTLFREQGALMRPGNRWLYGLLCKVRCNLKQRLSDVLAEGFGHNPTQHPNDDPILFSGCYFAATGETSDRQAFVKGVFDKLVEEQENVEWNRRALHASRRLRWISYACIAASGAMLVFFVTMIVFQALIL